MGDALKRGKLTSGKGFVIVVSDKSAVPEDGSHVILDILGSNGNALDHKDLMLHEKVEAMARLLEFLEEEYPDGVWDLALNGPGMARRPTFHVHGRHPSGPRQLIRKVKNLSDLLARLKTATTMEEVKELAAELEENMSPEPK